MGANGVPQPTIARALGADPKTLRRHDREELGLGAVRAPCTVAEPLLRHTTGDGPGANPAATFWLKVRAGWRASDGAEEQQR
ncbi:MAG: hypothetical protein IRZ13_16865 [Acetobacteraceae bacterium]|nr:hypothetical protein [Acetobacteraceae bacterium]